MWSFGGDRQWVFVLDSVTLRNAVISGTINEEYLRELLTTMGDRFTDEEVSVTADRQTDWVTTQLCNVVIAFLTAYHAGWQQYWINIDVRSALYLYTMPGLYQPWSKHAAAAAAVELYCTYLAHCVAAADYPLALLLCRSTNYLEKPR